MTTMLALQQVERGALDLDAPVVRYLPGFRLATAGRGNPDKAPEGGDPAIAELAAASVAAASPARQRLVELAAGDD